MTDSTNTEAIIRVENLDKRFGALHVLKGITEDGFCRGIQSVHIQG